MEGSGVRTKLQAVVPEEIERCSMELIQEELDHRGIKLEGEQAPIIKRVIHTSADFDYVENLVFTPHVLAKARKALEKGAWVVTDTKMAQAGINKKALAQFGGEAVCFMADEDVSAMAKANGTTRAVASMEKAAGLDRPLIFAIGNAPTALIRLCELVEEGRLAPELVIGVPVGFVNVVESKEMLLKMNIPAIVAKGRKGGSNIAAAIVNALLYSMKSGEHF